jgi:hypothetical protein
MTTLDFDDCDPERIRTWLGGDILGMMEYIKQYWRYADCGYWTQEGNHYFISTAGWSDNETIIEMMERNYVWWGMHWKASLRGGHYEFAPPGESALTVFPPTKTP